MIVKKFKYGDKVLIKSNGKCNGMCGVVVGIWEQYGYYNCLKVKVKNEQSICAYKISEIRPFGKILLFARLAESFYFDYYNK